MKKQNAAREREPKEIDPKLAPLLAAFERDPRVTRRQGFWIWRAQGER